MKHTIKYATILALIAAIISGTNNFLTKIAVTSVKPPLLFTTLKNALVAFFIIGLVLLFKKWSEIRALKKNQIIKLLAISVIGGSIPFALYFTGLTQTSALNASLIHKTLFLWVALLAIPLLKERLHYLQWLGIIAVFAANLVIGGFTGFSFNSGELMILGATMLWAIENIIAKKVLNDLSSLTVVAARMVIGSVVLLIVLLFQGQVAPIAELTLIQFGWTALTSVLLLCYVLTWYTALKYAPATYVATLLVPATLVTNILSAIFITHAFPSAQFFSALLFVTGIILLIVFAKKSKLQSPQQTSNQPLA